MTLRKWLAVGALALALGASASRGVAGWFSALQQERTCHSCCTAPTSQVSTASETPTPAQPAKCCTVTGCVTIQAAARKEITPLCDEFEMMCLPEAWIPQDVNPSQPQEPRKIHVYFQRQSLDATGLTQIMTVGYQVNKAGECCETSGACACCASKAASVDCLTTRLAACAVGSGALDAHYCQTGHTFPPVFEPNGSTAIPVEYRELLPMPRPCIEVPQARSAEACCAPPCCISAATAACPTCCTTCAQQMNVSENTIRVSSNGRVYLVKSLDSGTVETRPEIKDYRVSAGLGVRVGVPMLGPLPIALDFGFPVAKGPNGPCGTCGGVICPAEQAVVGCVEEAIACEQCFVPHPPMGCPFCFQTPEYQGGPVSFVGMNQVQLPQARVMRFVANQPGQQAGFAAQPVVLPYPVPPPPAMQNYTFAQHYAPAPAQVVYAEPICPPMASVSTESSVEIKVVALDGDHACRIVSKDLTGTFENLELMVGGEKISLQRGSEKHLIVRGSNFQATADTVRIGQKTILFDGNVRLQVRKDKSQHAEISSDHAAIDLDAGHVEIKLGYAKQVGVPTVAR